MAGLETPTAIDAARAGERVFSQVSDNLVRWIGPDGSQALFARALVLAQAQRSALNAIPAPARSGLFLESLAATVDPQDTNTVTDAAVMILATLIELLGRLIGNDLAIRLVLERAPGVNPSQPRRPVRPGAEFVP